MSYAYIVITGHYASGKLQFIRTLSSVEVTTYDYDTDFKSHLPTFTKGVVHLDERKSIVLYRPPGTTGYVPGMEEPYVSAKKLGYIFLINTHYLPHLLAFKEHVLLYCNQSYPVMFCTNFYGKQPLWTLEDLRAYLEIPNQLPLVHTNAMEYKTARKTLLQFLQFVQYPLTESS